MVPRSLADVGWLSTLGQTDIPTVAKVVLGILIVVCAVAVIRGLLRLAIQLGVLAVLVLAWWFWPTGDPSELRRVHRTPDAGAALVVIPGLASTDEWNALVDAAKREHAERLDIWCVQYPTDQSLEEVSRWLFSRLRTLEDEYRARRPVRWHLVGHSAGGLVAARTMLLNREQRARERLDIRTLTIGTPFRGASRAKLVPDGVEVAIPTAFADVVPDGQFVRSLRRDWRDACDDGWSPQLVSLWGREDLVVRYRDASPEGSSVEVTDGGHGASKTESRTIERVLDWLHFESGGGVGSRRVDAPQPWVWIALAMVCIGGIALWQRFGGRLRRQPGAVTHGSDLHVDEPVSPLHRWALDDDDDQGIP